MNFLYTLLVMLAITLIRICWYRLIDPPHKKQAVESARMMRERLIQKGLGHYLLRDYVFQTQITDDDRLQMSSVEAKLNSAFQEIKRCLNLPPEVRLVVLPGDSSERPKDGRAGDYNSGTKVVRVFYEKQYSGAEYIGVLCHECTHCFMYVNGLNYSDPVQNERFTDITAALLGFGVVMEIGFRTLGNTRKKSKKGYLKSAETHAIYQDLLLYRQQSASQKQQPPSPRPQAAQKQQPKPGQASANGEHTQLRNHINSARVMLEQGKSVMAVKKLPTATDLSQEAYARLYRTSQAIQSGQMAADLLRWEEALKKDAPAVRAAAENVMRLNRELSFFLNAFR